MGGGQLLYSSRFDRDFPFGQASGLERVQPHKRGHQHAVIDYSASDPTNGLVPYGMTLAGIPHIKLRASRERAIHDDDVGMDTPERCQSLYRAHGLAVAVPS